MTGDAKSSTSGASDGAAAGGTMLAALVQGNLDAARAFGFDADALQRAAGLSQEALADPDGRVPVARYVALWEAISADPRALSFGLWLGRSMTLPALGVVGYVMQHAPDVRAALTCLERFNGLLGDGVGPQISERGEHVVLHRVEPPRLARLLALSIAAPLGNRHAAARARGPGAGRSDRDRGRLPAPAAAGRHAGRARDGAGVPAALQRRTRCAWCCRARCSIARWCRPTRGCSPISSATPRRCRRASRARRRWRRACASCCPPAFARASPSRPRSRRRWR